MSDKIEIQIVMPDRCAVCGKPFGKTNLQYNGIEIWAGCNCMPVDQVYLINSALVRVRGADERAG